MEIWGGVECTMNRVGDEYFSQLKKSGHQDRLSDLDLFHELGLRTLRFPVLWEQFAPESFEAMDWARADLWLRRLQELGIRPIVGFVHHGSGPLYTSLLDPEFAEKLAYFAGKFAERYPWVDAYTPINEPLTTARFSGLYGTWYPHHRDSRSFLRMLWNECLGIRAAMKAVRKSNPKAKLVQTEDLGKIYSTDDLRYQADFENHRRWLSFDILCGQFDKRHPLYTYALGEGINVEDVDDFCRDPCIPDVIGINHYVTSDRFLDSRLYLYPSELHGGNGRHWYADVEAVRMREVIGHRPVDLLLDAWQRFRIPIAITEIHLGCTEDEQMRWLRDMREAALKAAYAGAEVQAITIWSLLGSFDWNTLVTCDSGYYEPGVFDLRKGEPEATQLADMVRAYTKGEEFEHPVLEKAGWWKSSDRYLHSIPEIFKDADDRNSGKWVFGSGFSQRARRIEAV